MRMNWARLRLCSEIRRKFPAHANSSANQIWASHTSAPKDDSDGHTVTSDGAGMETLTVYSPRARNRFNQVVEAKRFEGAYLCRKVKLSTLFYIRTHLQTFWPQPLD